MTVRCDRVRVGAVLGNSISNAVKYNVNSTKTVRIYSSGEAPPTLYVADNGIGIPFAQREAVFRIFRRLHEPEAYGGGSGIGLSIACKIVERHGGRMWVEGTRGAGTIIAFTLAPADGLARATG